MDNLKDLTAPCGIDCFNCEFQEKNIQGYFASMPPEKKAMYDKRGMTAEKLTCKGCRVQGGCKIHPEGCDTLSCVKAKGVEFCYECAEFPCIRLQPLAEGAATYPHNLKVFNLATIRNKGLENWASEVKTVRVKYFKGKFKIGAGPQL